MHKIGLMAVKRPLHIRDLRAKILRSLGLHHNDLSIAVSGRRSVSPASRAVLR